METFVHGCRETIYLHTMIDRERMFLLVYTLMSVSPYLPWPFRLPPGDNYWQISVNAADETLTIIHWEYRVLCWGLFIIVIYESTTALTKKKHWTLRRRLIT